MKIVNFFMFILKIIHLIPIHAPPSFRHCPGLRLSNISLFLSQFPPTFLLLFWFLVKMNWDCEELWGGPRYHSQHIMFCTATFLLLNILLLLHWGQASVIIITMLRLQPLEMYLQYRHVHSGFKIITPFPIFMMAFYDISSNVVSLWCVFLSYAKVFIIMIWSVFMLSKLGVTIIAGFEMSPLRIHLPYAVVRHGIEIWAPLSRQRSIL